MNDDNTNVNQTTEPAGGQQGSGQQQTPANAKPTTPAATITGDAAGQGANQPQGNAAGGQQAAESVQYDFSKVQMPEGYTLDEAESKQFLEVIKGMGLNNEQAGNIVKFGAEYGKRLVDAVQAEHQQMIAEWGETAKKELGADFDKTVALCGSAIEHMKDIAPGLRQALDETGAGNRIEIVRVLAKLGEMLNGDPGKAAGGGANANGAQGTNFKTLYPNTNFDKYRA